MASKVIFLLGIVASIACVNGRSIERRPEGSSTGDNREISTEVPKPEVSGDLEAVSIAVDDEDRVEIEKSALIEKRSVKEDDVKVIPSNAIAEEKEDDNDLETAAGSNILRPLFVYRQQLAYRERVRKAGRRAAPNP